MRQAKTTIAAAQDHIETSILLAMYATDKKSARKPKLSRGTDGLFSREIFELGMFCPKEAEFPKDMLIYDLADSSRLYTDGLDALVVSPIKAIGRRLETALICEDGSLKWVLFKPMLRPKGIVALTNRPVHWFATHYRHIHQDGREEYVRAPMPIADGRVPLMKVLAFKGFDAVAEQKQQEQLLALQLSIFEDANRTGAFLTTVEEAVRLSFPVGEDSYKAFFALRDGLRDTPTGRRNPLLHWCAEHIRRNHGNITPVAGHNRGKQELVHAGMRLTIRPCEDYRVFAEGK